jgi:hypothetical protein
VNTSARDRQPTPPAALRPPPRRLLTFGRLKWTSFTHSCIYLALLVCAFAAGKPEPATFVLGLAHGLLWIFMSLACIAAARLRVVSLRLAVAVAVLGGVGPFFGSLQFIREQRPGEEGSRRVDGQTAQPATGATARARVNEHGDGDHGSADS